MLAENIEVPIMHPDEILAEKIVSWWLFGHAKHYNDMAFLAGQLLTEGRDIDARVRGLVRALVAKKLDVNRAVSDNLARRVAALDDAERKRRLAGPDDHVDPKHDFDSLSYLHQNPPKRASVNSLVQRVLMPVLFE